MNGAVGACLRAADRSARSTREGVAGGRTEAKAASDRARAKLSLAAGGNAAGDEAGEA